ncbi:MAG TPA: PqqD family protein, partial [Solirubrobacteraceae bacterium]|nr:PqqD family protein [Solirubrobacteraceae bacterium]
MEILDTRPSIPAHVVHRALADETVILNLQTGRYHGLNPTAAKILESLTGASTVRAAAAQVAAHYGRPTGSVEQDVARFCRDLADRGLL